MKRHSLTLGIALCFTVGTMAVAQVQDIDSELSKLTEKLAPSIKEKGKKKIAVIDFTDLQGNAKGELGKYIAEQLTVNFVITKPDFAILDRANLQRILAEHKLTATGLIDPENAKKLGLFAGVDALVLGTIIPKGVETIALNAKVITTDTAEIIGAARGEFRYDELVEQFQPKPKTDATASPVASAVREPQRLPPTATSQPVRQANQPTPVSTPALASDRSPNLKSFGDLVVELQSLVVEDRYFYRLELELKNQNARKSIWAAVSCEQNGTARFWLRDPEKVEFDGAAQYVKGVEAGAKYYDGTFLRATEIKPGESVSGTIRFRGRGGRAPTPGECSVGLEFLSATSMNPGSGGRATIHSMTAKIEAK